MRKINAIRTVHNVLTLQQNWTPKPQEIFKQVFLFEAEKTIYIHGFFSLFIAKCIYVFFIVSLFYTQNILTVSFPYFSQNVFMFFLLYLFFEK